MDKNGCNGGDVWKVVMVQRLRTVRESLPLRLYESCYAAAATTVQRVWIKLKPK